MKTFILLFLLNYFLADLSYSLSLKAGLKATKAADPFEKMSDAELEKMLKEMGMSTKEIGALGTDDENKAKAAASLDDKRKQVEKRPLTFPEMIQKNRKALREFEMSQRDAFNLIYNVKKFPIFSRLPLLAMNLINQINNNPQYKSIEELHKNKTEETNNLISNTLNSQIFIDHENKMGRKGVLTIIDKLTGKVENSWAVLNNKVFAFYKTSNFLNIKHIFRVSLIKVKNTIYTPCFFIYYDNLHEEEKQMEELKRLEIERKKQVQSKLFDPRKKTKKSRIIESMNDGKLKDEKLEKLKKMELPPLDADKKKDYKNANNEKNSGSGNSNRVVQQTDEDLFALNFSNSQFLVCALNFREKDYWLSTLLNNKESYKDFDLINN